MRQNYCALLLMCEGTFQGVSVRFTGQGDTANKKICKYTYLQFNSYCNYCKAVLEKKHYPTSTVDMFER